MIEIALHTWRWTTERIDASGWRYDPDPDWSFTDRNGNEHRWERSETGEWELPSLRHRTREIQAACPECGQDLDEMEVVSEWYVPETEEVVRVGYLKRFKDESVAGLSTLHGKGVLSSDKELLVKVGDIVMVVDPIRVKAMVVALYWDQSECLTHYEVESIGAPEEEDKRGALDRIG